MDYLQYLTNPYAVIGLIVFVAAGAVGAGARGATGRRMKTLAPAFFAVAIVALVATIAVVWIEAEKAKPDSQTAGGSTGDTTTINAEGGSNAVNNVSASDSGSVTINQGGQGQ